MTEKDMVWGNPWHGKLAAGTIELEAGTPVSSITVDGATWTVASVSGNLGDTRYYRSPDLTDPPAISEVAALHGAFKRDAIVYSDDFRWTPLSNKKVLDSAFCWLLWDGTALAWRKMKIEYTWQTLTTSSPAGDPCCAVTIWRGPLAGRLNRVESQSYTLIATLTLPYTYSYNPRWRPSAFGYDPAGRRLSMEARRDGRRIILRVEAKRLSGLGGYPAPGYADGFVIWDAAARYLFDVFEVSLADDGTTAAAPVAVYPPAGEDITTTWTRWKFEVNGSLYWDTPVPADGYPGYVQTRYFLPLKLTAWSNSGDRVATSIMLTAAYDKDGALRIPTYEQTTLPITTVVGTGDFILAPNLLHSGVVVFPETDDPADHIPSYTLDTSEHYVPWGLLGSFGDIVVTLDGSFNNTPRDYSESSSVDPNHTVRIIDGTETLKTWAAPHTETISVEVLTNNVVDLRSASGSLIRVGPGKVNDGTMSLPVYATFDPRAGVVHSSASPVGIV